MIRGDDVMIHYSVFSTPCRRAPADAAQSRRGERRLIRALGYWITPPPQPVSALYYTYNCGRSAGIGAERSLFGSRYALVRSWLEFFT